MICSLKKSSLRSCFSQIPTSFSCSFLDCLRHLRVMYSSLFSSFSSIPSFLSRKKVVQEEKWCFIVPWVHMTFPVIEISFRISETIDQGEWERAEKSKQCSCCSQFFPSAFQLMDNLSRRKSRRKWESAEKQLKFSRLSFPISSWIHDSISGSNYLCFPLFQCAWVVNLSIAPRTLTTKSASNPFRPLLMIPYSAPNVISENKEPPDADEIRTRP